MILKLLITVLFIFGIYYMYNISKNIDKEIDKIKLYTRTELKEMICDLINIITIILISLMIIIWFI